MPKGTYQLIHCGRYRVADLGRAAILLHAFGDEPEGLVDLTRDGVIDVQCLCVAEGEREGRAARRQAGEANPTEVLECSFASARPATLGGSPSDASDEGLRGPCEAHHVLGQNLAGLTGMADELEPEVVHVLLPSERDCDPESLSYLRVTKAIARQPVRESRKRWSG